LRLFPIAAIGWRRRFFVVNLDMEKPFLVEEEKTTRTQSATILNNVKFLAHDIFQVMGNN